MKRVSFSVLALARKCRSPVTSSLELDPNRVRGLVRRLLGARRQLVFMWLPAPHQSRPADLLTRTGASSPVPRFGLFKGFVICHLQAGEQLNVAPGSGTIALDF